MCQGIALNSTSNIAKDGKLLGDKTECALLKLCTMVLEDASLSVLRNAHSPPEAETEASSVSPSYAYIRAAAHTLRTFTFASERKTMSTIALSPDGATRIYVKTQPDAAHTLTLALTGLYLCTSACQGAAEIVLQCCDSVMTVDGEDVLDATTKERILNKVINKYADEGLRTICIAQRTLGSGSDQFVDVHSISQDDAELNLTLVAIVGIEDPLRLSVPKSVAACQHAGIQVRMVTGDNLKTACSIAEKCGIIDSSTMLEPRGMTKDVYMDLSRSKRLKYWVDQGVAMEGKTFRQLVAHDDGSINQYAFDLVYPKLRVLARSSPTDKMIMVVAVTGDGINDATALRYADVGFAMGITGTAVAQKACDIILLDDNFDSVVAAIKWGRNVYDSVTKFLQFQLTVNLVAISVAIVGACALSESPLGTVQLLWVNLIMDSLASLALATEEPSEAVLDRPPNKSTDPLISAPMLRFITGHATHQLVILFVLVFYGDTLFGVPDARDHLGEPTTHFTIVFNTFVQLQLFNQFNARKLKGTAFPASFQRRHGDLRTSY
eukprot:gene1890-2573_t